MLDSDNSDLPTTQSIEDAPAKAAPRRRAARKAAPVAQADGTEAPAAPRKRAAKKVALTPAQPSLLDDSDSTDQDVAAPAKKAARKRAGAKAASDTADETAAATKTTRKRAAKKAAATDDEPAASAAAGDKARPALTAPSVLFVPPSEGKTPTRTRRSAKAAAGPPPSEDVEPAAGETDITVAEAAEDQTA
jgi:hypothetical protein